MDYKSLLTSKTFWGLIASALILLFRNLFSIDLGDQELLVSDLLQMASLSYAFYGRVRATKKIK